MLSTTPRTPYLLLRAVIERIALFGVFLLFIQTWGLDGLLRPYTIAGASMALTLLGEHRQVICKECGITFDCDSSFWPVSPRAVCPNCGYAENDMESLPDLAGDRVLIDRSAFEFRSPRRWEVVVFRPPRQTESLAVKRVVGLPGETVEIREGHVYINGEIARKPLPVQIATATAVDDANYTSPGLPSRWKAEKTESHWDFTADSKNGKRRISCDGASKEIDWLVYRHSRRLPGQEGHTETAAVEDTLTYNQNRPRRVEDVHAVSDLLLSFNLVKVSGSGKLFLRATDGQTAFRVELDIGHQTVAVFQDDAPLDIPENDVPVKSGMNIIVSLFDRQFLLALDNRPILTFPLLERVNVNPLSTEPFAIGAQEVNVVLGDLGIFRNIYYTDPIGRNPYGWGNVPAELREDNYYVLGDNSSISEDSRTWGAYTAVSSNSLLGKPLVVIFPARLCTLFGRQFQIPDWSRIRYIR